MAFYTATFSTDPGVFDIIAVEGGNAAELELRARAALAAATANALCDASIGAFAAGRDWEIFFTVADSVTGVSVNVGNETVYVVDGANEAEVRANMLARLNADSVDQVHVFVAEGSGLGPRWLALAITSPTE